MKTKITFFIVAVLLTFNCAAQTYVSGFINVNTTWNLAGSPYIVSGNALLSHGYTLTINPGVVVKFDSAKALQIDGELIAIGTPSNRITFTSNKPIPHAGDWAKLHFSDTCMNAVFDSLGNYLSGCIMKYCDVMYGGGLGYGEIHIEGSSPYFSHCSVLLSNADGIYDDNSKFVIDSSAIKNCNNFGIDSYNSSMLYPHDAKILSDTIENNLHGGMQYDYGNGYEYTVIKNNSFISNLTNGAIIAHSQFWYITISNNYFYNNSSNYGIISFDNINHDTISCNRFVYNHSSTSGCITIISLGCGAIVNNNIFEYNDGPTAVVSLSPVQTQLLTFSGNYIANNISTSTSYGNCKFNVNYNNNFSLQIDHNSFINNTGRSAFSVLGSGTGSINFSYIKHNNFINPGTTFQLDNQMPFGSQDIYADSNYWGSTSTAYIDSAISDYFDNATLSIVYYSPILTSPIEIDTTCAPYDSSIITHIINPEIANTILIYPNPATMNLTIEVPQQSIIEISNIEGQLIKTFASTGNKTNIDISAFARGMYFVKIKTEKGVESRKFVKL